MINMEILLVYVYSRVFYRTAKCQLVECNQCWKFSVMQFRVLTIVLRSDSFIVAGANSGCNTQSAIDFGLTDDFRKKYVEVRSEKKKTIGIR